MNGKPKQPREISETIKKSGGDATKPSIYYRAAHPELFSDTTKTKKARITRSFLEFHLDQITANKKEQQFEEFCRRLAEKEICTNLVPQTGPTGGGDSKVDAATYPVAGQLAECRYWGGNAAPTNEDWAFAFSAKRDWRGKVKDDVAKVANLPRKFQQVFFITNQPARDKERAALEVTLTQASGLRVTILDRTWIVRKIIDNQLDEILIECLGLDIDAREEVHRGPRDVEREQRLTRLLDLLKDPNLSPQNKYALAQDFLEAAKLAAQLERSRAEVDRLFLQAQNLALKSTHVGLIVRCHYHHAWLTYFYFDDAAGAETIFEKITHYLPELTDADDVEMFCNLTSVLQSAHDTGFFKQSEEKVKKRSFDLKVRLEAIASDGIRHNNALHAETLLHSLKLRESMHNKEVARETFKALKKCLKRSAGLGTYGFKERGGIGIVSEPVMKFLRERMRHFDLDIPHEPMFGRPPGSWPKV